MKIKTPPKIYFPNLNGLRCIAASLVIIHHTEQFKSLFKWKNYYDGSAAVKLIGLEGVVLFFVLSGFLITYLLLHEEGHSGFISLRNFYWRRILRIWPLYFLLLFVVLMILPQFTFLELPFNSNSGATLPGIYQLSLYLLVLPNLAQAIFGALPYLSHTWSIGAEEQFYALWPVLLKYVKKYRVALFSGIIMLYVGVDFLLQSSIAVEFPQRSIVFGFWHSLNMSCMAIGGIFAFILFKRNKILTLICKSWIFFPALLTVVLSLWYGLVFQYLTNEYYALLFGIIILNLAANPNYSLVLEQKALNYLGKISYGMYMYHPLVIVLVLNLALRINVTSNWLILPFTFLLTIIVSGLSHHYVESYFTSFKRKF